MSCMVNPKGQFNHGFFTELSLNRRKTEMLSSSGLFSNLNSL
jgi:hypothetical protein